MLFHVLKYCQDAASFGSTLSRCPIFRQYPVKMSHLSAGSMLCVVSCTQILSRCLIFRQYPVKMSHLLAGSMCVLCHVPKYCQDVASFGSTLSRCLIFRQEACCVLCHVLKYCQNDIVCLMLSFCKCYVDFFHPILLCL